MTCVYRDKFCLVCGLYAPKNKMRIVTSNFTKAYQSYFSVKLPLNQWYIPNVVCFYCYFGLLKSYSQNFLNFKYVNPVKWFPNKRHIVKQCYFCQNNTKTLTLKYEDRATFAYFNSDKVQPAVERNKNVLNTQNIIQNDSDDSDEDSINTISDNDDYCEEPHLVTQSDFNDLIKDTNMSSRSAEILASRLQEWRLVAPDFCVSAGRKRANNSIFKGCFIKDESTGITYTPNVAKVFEVIGHPYDPSDWRLFIDGSVKSIKGVLLHIGNIYPSIPIMYATKVKETYENIKIILRLIKYEEHSWLICCDLKIVAIMMGLKSGYPKQQCFICLWEGRRKDLHYTDFQWQNRLEFKTGSESVIHEPLVPKERIIIPPLHIKLGLVRNFVKALQPDGEPINVIKAIFPSLSKSKIENGM